LVEHAVDVMATFGAFERNGNTAVADSPPALLLRNVSKRFGPQVALDSVDLEIRRGEIQALVGQNGSGKSTLVKIVAGYHEPDDGSGAEIAGVPFRLGSAVAAREAGIRFVHQDLGLVERLSVSDNFGLDRTTNGGLLRPIHRRAEQADAQAALAALGYDLAPTALVASLAESERTAVAIARALDQFDKGSLLVLDEPTATLPGPEAARLFTALRRVAAGGTAILFISHHLDEVLGLADYVTVLRDGRRVATTHVGELSHDSLVELLLGRELRRASPSHERAAESTGSRPEFEVRGLFGASLAALDFDARAGDIIGVAGLTGSGREEVAGLLSGRLPRGGDVRIAGRAVAPGDPEAAVHAGICSVPSDRLAQALLPKASVRENVTLADLTPFWRGLRLRRKLERRMAREWVTKLDVRPPEPERSVLELSGGNQQKVVLARWLRVAPAVIVLDEPTQGVDVGSKADIHRLVDEAAGAGAVVVVCSTDADELARLCGRVIVLRRGRAGVCLRGDDVHTERIEQEQLLAAEPAIPPTPTTTPDITRRTV
jgi:ribose transport system ATP-binding protein